jgi:uncharacterized protein (DUF885 family)
MQMTSNSLEYLERLRDDGATKSQELKMKSLFSIAVILLFGLQTFAATSPECESMKSALARESGTKKLKKFLDLRWKYVLKESPEFASSLGYPGSNDRWQDLSLQAIARREAEDICQLELLKKIPKKGLSHQDQIDHRLMEYMLTMDVEGAKFGGKYLAMGRQWGMHTDIPETLARAPKYNRQAYEDMIKRLKAVPRLEEQTETLLTEGVRLHVVPPKVTVVPTLEQFDRLLTAKTEDSPVFSAFKEINAPISSEQKKNIQEAALNAIKNDVYPALKKLRSFMEKTYIPVAKESVALQDMPNGKAWYNYQIEKSTTTHLTADELHALGLKEVARILGEMEKVREGLKFKGTLKEFNHFLLTEKRFFYSDKESLLAGYRDVAKRIDPELTKLFLILPRLTYGVHAIADYMENSAPTAYFEPGNLEAGRPGYFAANTSNLPSRPKWAMEVLTAHEAVPGHHLQISLAQELASRPEIFRFNSYEAFTEGWGLYAEKLGEEINLYKDPYSKYGELSYELWRAVRLVVDTGIHAKGWSRDKAIEYFQDLLPKSRAEAESEVDRYISWPGQALAYKVGQMKFLELRTRAENQLKDKFDIRKFHSQVL